MIGRMLMTIFASLLLTPDFTIFVPTKSPSGRYAIAYRDPKPGEVAPKDDGPTVNELVDLKAKKVVFILKGFHGFLNENHGGMEMVYNKAEIIAVLMRAGKWEPRNLAFLAPSAGKYADVLSKVQADARDFADKGHKSGYVWNVMGAKCIGDKVLLCVAGEVPKSENTPVVYLSLSYQLKPTKTTLGVGKAKPARLTQSQVWFWPLYK